MNDWLNRILYELLPGKCILCLKNTDRLIDLCLDCELDLPRITNPCWQCGLTIPQGQEICGSCLLHPPPFSHCFSAFAYTAPVDRLINQFKNHQKIIVGKVLAQVMCQEYMQRHLVLPDSWLPVPLHKNRLKSRGFNQALEIAEVLADTTHIPVESRIARRIKYTDDQKSLSAKQRARNIKNVFVIDQHLNGRSVGIVDDVVTTASTITELSRLLLDNGATDVQIVCLARTQIDRL
ncbi:MAG: ComF family protein [bacterium]|nr:ComF family protein [Gammaproteobacteria bacterium]